jgi:dTDP-4-dehydrorhamnose 3,5-epimerase-like enzyme
MMCDSKKSGDIELITFPVESYKDHRASRFFDLYPQLSGQITTSVIEPNQFSGWHKHALQYDQFFVVDGTIKVATISPQGEVIEYRMSSDGPKTLQIPAGYWHCYHSGNDRAVLIYYLSRKHDEADEIRATEDEIKAQYGYQINF